MIAGEACLLAYADPSHLFFSPNDWREIFIRMGLALLAGGAVGLNRDRVKRPAGLRTYMTVSVGSAFFVMLILQAGVDFNATNALSRTVQGITTGVGFIGAGLIFHQQSEQNNASIKSLQKNLLANRIFHSLDRFASYFL